MTTLMFIALVSDLLAAMIVISDLGSGGLERQGFNVLRKDTK